MELEWPEKMPAPPKRVFVVRDKCEGDYKNLRDHRTACRLDAIYRAHSFKQTCAYLSPDSISLDYADYMMAAAHYNRGLIDMSLAHGDDDPAVAELYGLSRWLVEQAEAVYATDKLLHAEAPL